MLKRKPQSLRVILKVRDIRALPANIPLRTRIFLVTSDLHDLTAFCDDLQAAVLATQYTGSFLPFVHVLLSFYEIRLFAEFIAIFYTHLHNDVPPATTLYANIRATEPFESHFIGINT